MQNRFVGDIGDFGKFGLLNALCRGNDYEPALRMGIIWYLTPDSGNAGHGQSIDYLSPMPGNLRYYRACDPILYDKLAEIVFSNRRNVASIQAASIFPPNTLYYDAPLSFDGIAARERENYRWQWWFNARYHVIPCDLVFLDPDNGLEVQSKPSHYVDAPKYVFYEEIEQLAGMEQTIVIYHHHCRENEELQLSKRIDELEALLPERTVRAITFVRYSRRTYFIIPANGLEAMVQNRLDRLLNSPWWNHFVLFK